MLNLQLWAGENTWGIDRSIDGWTERGREREREGEIECIDVCYAQLPASLFLYAADGRAGAVGRSRSVT